MLGGNKEFLIKFSTEDHILNLTVKSHQLHLQQNSQTANCVLLPCGRFPQISTQPKHVLLTLRWTRAGGSWTLSSEEQLQAKGHLQWLNMHRAESQQVRAASSLKTMSSSSCKGIPCRASSASWTCLACVVPLPYTTTLPAFAYPTN